MAQTSFDGIEVIVVVGDNDAGDQEPVCSGDITKGGCSAWQQSEKEE